MRLPRKSGSGKKIYNICRVCIQRGSTDFGTGHFSPFIFPPWYKWWIELLPKASEFKYVRVLFTSDRKMDQEEPAEMGKASLLPFMILC